MWLLSWILGNRVEALKLISCFFFGGFPLQRGFGWLLLVWLVRGICRGRKKMWLSVLLDGILEVQSSPRNYFRGGNLGILSSFLFPEAFLFLIWFVRGAS
jgi:hypothetical protein